MELEIIIGIIGICFFTIATIVTTIEVEPIATFFSLIMLMLSIISIVTGVQGNCECTHNHNCEHQITYTYQCKLCDETVKQTEEPKIKLCEECIATIKEIESEED